MALQNVPWAIGDGAHNSVEGARLSLFAATGGKGGVMSPTDMQVTALPVPGGAVRVHTGGAVVVSGYPGASSQAYAMREIDSTDVPITATGSSGSRRSYLVGRISDHQYSGEPTPDNVQDGPYNRYEWMSVNPRSNPPAYPVELLARVDQPANTATITQDMITDMRRLANPRREEFLFARPRVWGDEDLDRAKYLRSRWSVGGELFPGGNGSQNIVYFDIPDYATHMIIEAQWMGIFVYGGEDGWGYYWVEYGDEYRPSTWPNGWHFEHATQTFNWNTVSAGNNYTTNWLLADTYRIPEKLRGSRVGFAFKAAVSDNANASRDAIGMGARGGLMLRVTVTEDPISRHAV